MTTEMNDTHVKEYALAETKRHKPCLIYRGYRYVQDKIQNRTIYWRCEDRSHCNGRAHQLIANESLPVLTIKHNHSPIPEDLSRHDIVSVDSHRRRRRRQQNREALTHYSTDKNDLLLSPTMTSSIKLENNPNKHHRVQQQHATMVKNLHLSEVIRTTAASHTHPYTNRTTNGHTTVDPIEMTKLLSNITTTSTKSPSKTTSMYLTTDYPSRLNHFSWEEIEGRYVPVIYRNENGIYQRYTSKMYVENTLFQSEAWQRHLILARSLPPLVSYSYTEHELNLFRNIISWHLASFYFKTIPSTDCLIRFEDLWDFYTTLRKLRDTISTTSFNRTIAPVPSSSKPTLQSQSFEVPTPVVPSSSKQRADVLATEKTSKESGWVQINNVFVPYIIKIKLRDNELNKCHTRQPAPQLQREFYVPYEILIKCNIFSDTEFTFKKFLIKATQQDFDLLNNLITNINIFDEKVPEKTLLVNLYHVMVGLNRILYIKFLPTKQPRTQVNKYHAEVLTHKGGTLLMNGNKLLPYIVQNSRFYVPLLYTFHSLPTFLLQAKRSARAPRQYEIDYLNLLFIYFSIDIPPLTVDTLLVDIFNIKCPNLQTPIHFRTLHEQQQYEKSKLLNAIARTTSTSKSSTGSSSTSKTTKCPPANVVVNPMIHHPSFYGLAAPNPVLSQVKQPEMKVITFNHHSLNAIVKSSDSTKNDWKISIKEIFQQFSFEIDYQKFIQWCQTNLLLPLIKLDEEETKLLSNSHEDDYYIYQQHLDRCMALLNDLQRGTISMTLLPPPPPANPESQQFSAKSPLAGAKKRKAALPTTRHTSPITTLNETNSLSKATSPELPSVEESTKFQSNDIPIEYSNDQITCPIVDEDDIMPVVASVEEEQPIEEVISDEMDTTFVIVETNDCNDERIQLDDTVSSGCELSTVLNPSHEDAGDHNDDDDDEKQTTVRSREHSPKISPVNQKKVTRKRQRNGYVKPRSRARSSTPRAPKKLRPMDGPTDENTSLVMIITSDKIEQHLRTLFMAVNDAKRTRTRPVKTPTRLVEEINGGSNSTTTLKTLESDTNVFDILSSSTNTDTIDQPELIDTSPQSCTYNVVASIQPNKLGLTIKKVVQP